MHRFDQHRGRRFPTGTATAAGLAVLCVWAQAFAQAPAKPGDSVAVEEIEEIEEVEAVAPEQPASGAAAKADAKPGAAAPAAVAATTDDGADAKEPMGLITLTGHFHPAVVHFPIAWLVLLLLVELAALKVSLDGLASLGLWLHAGLVGSFIPAIVTGLIRADELPSDEPADVAEVLEHRNLMLIAAAICLLALGWRWLKRTDFKGAPRFIYVALLFVATLVVTYAGHEGGKLVYGEDFFPF